MTATTTALVHAVAVYFGGPYDPATRSYRTPQVTGLGLVRRALPKRMDLADYHAGQPEPGVDHGSYLVPMCAVGKRARETRLTVPLGAGLKERRTPVDLYIFTRSHAAHAEDAQDYVHTLFDALIAHLEADPACGTGGTEAGGLWLGEGDRLGLEWEFLEPTVSKDVTHQLIVISASALQYVQG